MRVYAIASNRDAIHNIDRLRLRLMSHLSDCFYDVILSNFYLGRQSLHPSECLYIGEVSRFSEIENHPQESPHTNLNDVFRYRDINLTSIPSLAQTCKKYHETADRDVRKFVRIVVISDTHTRHRKIGELPAADILIHCGDILMVNRKYSKHAGIAKLKEFNLWLGTLRQFKEIIVSAGNHDLIFEQIGAEAAAAILSHAKYTPDSCFQAFGLSFFSTCLSEKSSWGSSKNNAFQSTEYGNSVQQKAISSIISTKIDILISHGCCSDLVELVKPRVHLWGHSHSRYGVSMHGECISVCAALMDEGYALRHRPVVLDIASQTGYTSSDDVLPEKSNENISSSRYESSNGSISSMCSHFFSSSSRNRVVPL